MFPKRYLKLTDTKIFHFNEQIETSSETVFMALYKTKVAIQNSVDWWELLPFSFLETIPWPISNVY